MDREEAIYILKNAAWLGTDEDREKTEQAIDMAIEALSQPNYETDTEVRLAVTNRKKEKVILWDAYGEVEYYPIEALSAEPTDLISRAELLDRIKAINSIPWGDDHGNAVKLVWSTEEVKRIIEKAPSADRPSGEWKQITPARIYDCSNCGHYVLTDDIEEYNYCPNCGAKMGSDT